MTGVASKQLAIRSPEFEYSTSDVIGLEMEVQIGQPGEKTTGLASVTLRTDRLSGYDMKVKVQTKSGAWSPIIETGGVCIQVRGEYERQILIAALQQIGLLTLPVYGKIPHGPFESSEE